MLVLALPRDVVEAALPPVEARLARRPDGWSNLAARGKLRRLLGDRGGLEDLRAAAGTHLRVFAADAGLLTAANLYRQAGDERWRGLLERLRDQLQAEPETSTTGAGLLLEACFLLGDDTGVRAAAAADPGPRHREVLRLTAGRSTGNVALVDAAVAALERQAARERALVTGAMNGYDWLEVALVTRVQVTGEPSDRLVEI